jgi:CubicO group peptidase (beta-lactamase class C family)
MKKLLLLACLSLLLAPNASKAQPAFIKDSLDTYVARVMQQWNIPGMAICVVKDGKVEVMKGYGVRDVETKAPVTDETLFMIASNSKAFTGTALAMLDGEKRISLDDKVTKWMPDFKLYDEYSTKEVTIRDLLCHRIGLETFQGDFLNWGSNLSRKQIIEKMRLHKPAYPFRYTYGYCNGAFLTAGEIIPLATDTSWDDFLKARFFSPLQMTRTTTDYKGITTDVNAAVPYTLFKNKLVKLAYPDLGNLGPAASINSCVKDLSHWVTALLANGMYEGKQVIPQKAISLTRTPQMLVNHLSQNFPSTHFSAYGLGWELADFAGRKMISHSGGADGFVTSVCLFPEEKLGIVVLTNTDANYMYDGVKRQIIDAYLDQPYRDDNALYYSRFEKNTKADNDAIAVLEAKVDAKNKPDFDLSALAGKYENEVYGMMEIKIEKNQPVMYFEHHPAVKGFLKYEGDHKFLCVYSSAMYGEKEIPFTIDNNTIKSCTVSVNDFIDYKTYEFIKK